MNNLSKLLLEAADLLTEGVVKTNRKPEIKLDKYLKKYGFEGDKKSGTITVNGKKIEIDRDIKSKTTKLKNGEIIPRQTAMDTTSENDRIIIGKEFTNLKNNKRRDALLQHEIGHIKYHNISSKNITKDSRDAQLQSMSKDMSISNHGTYLFSDDYKKQLEENFPDKSKTPNKYTEHDKERHKNLHKFEKYERINKPHANKTEFEADAYASQQKNGSHLKRAIRNGYKYMTSKKGVDDQIKSMEASLGEKLYIDDKTKKAIKKDENIHSQHDMNQRSKALKDKSINKQVYRESIEHLLNEAIELLDL